MRLGVWRSVFFGDSSSSGLLRWFSGFARSRQGKQTFRPLTSLIRLFSSLRVWCNISVTFVLSRPSPTACMSRKQKTNGYQNPEHVWGMFNHRSEDPTNIWSRDCGNVSRLLRAPVKFTQDEGHEKATKNAPKQLFFQADEGHEKATTK